MVDRLTRFARSLRRKQTEEERRLWAQLRNRRLGGLKFRRQQPVGPFVADFVCEAAKLIVELDGSQHDAPVARRRDEQRTVVLNNLGYDVYRVWNSDITNNMHGVLDGILASASASRSAPSSGTSCHLLPQGEGKNKEYSEGDK